LILGSATATDDDGRLFGADLLLVFIFEITLEIFL
jgi:hypothetical protein